MVRNLFLVFFLGLTSIKALAIETYVCKDSAKENPIGVSYQISLEETKLNGVNVFTYTYEIYKKDGSLWEKATGLGSISESYENGQVVLKKYFLADGSELVFITKDSIIRFINRMPSGNISSFTDCSLK